MCGDGGDILIAQDLAERWHAEWLRVAHCAGREAALANDLHQVDWGVQQHGAVARQGGIHGWHAFPIVTVA